MHRKYFFHIAVLLAVFAVLLTTVNETTPNQQRSCARIQKEFYKKQLITTGCINDLKESNLKVNVSQDLKLEKTGISLLVYDRDSLVLWSDNSLPIGYIDIDTLVNNTVVNLLHSTFYCIVDSSKGHKFLGFIHLSNDYPYQNKFLRNGFSSDFKISKRVNITFDNPGPGACTIFNHSGEAAFHVSFSNNQLNESSIIRIIATALLFLSFYFFLLYIRSYLKRIDDRKKGKAVLGVLAVLLSIRLVLLFTGVLTNRFLLFDPFLYATRLAPTFGDLVLNTLLFFFVSYLINRFVVLPANYLKYTFNQRAWIGILNVLYIIVLLYAHHANSSLISHSSIDVVVHNISQIRFPVIIAYLLLAINYLTVLFIAIWIFKNITKVKVYRMVINCFVLLAVVFFIGFVLRNPIDIYTIVFAAIIYILSWYIQNKLDKRAILSYLVLFLLLFSVYIMLFSVNLTNKKDLLKNKSMAISLSSEHDPVAEYLFDDISVKLESDTSILNHLSDIDFDIIQLYQYLEKNYFNGYWKKYELRITVCQPDDSVIVNGTNLYLYPCYDFFSELVEREGLKIPRSAFYYVDKYTGLINYLGWVKYKRRNKEEISLFIELDSRLTTKPLGYPELLLNEGVKTRKEMDYQSYAKYYLGNLISHNGDYDYSLISSIFTSKKGERFYEVEYNGYIHLVYKPNKENLIVVSEPKTRILDYLILFSYVFVFYYLSALMIIFLFFSQYRHINFRDSLRNKIQFSVILILITSLVLIAGSTTWFNIRKYNQTQFRILEEKINSVYVELEHKLAFEETLTSDWYSPKYDNLGQLLVKFSDVFYSDINLFDPHGNLLASSRDEVFQLGLQSKKMDPIAFYKMNEEKLARFVHRENINKLSYLSAYVPFTNSNGDLLAYLNLPYFTKQRELQEDITTLTVAIINIYVLLILLTIVIAVVISDQVTRPLEMIQDRFRALKLGAAHEPIKYSKNDEIGRLVNEYNRMVLELEKNIELLAKSERESAWREMAKQVAHEIKNPLTPMRLSVQQLKRSWDDKKEKFGDYLNKVTETLIEQIDNLSTIASEFSNFAKMPIANIEEIKLNAILENAVSLFASNDNVQLKFNTIDRIIWVMADADQLSRVFINILKNSIQAIPEDRKGTVEINLETIKDMVKVTVTDNGKGIPDEIKSKLFTPNFTTKSGGMGLGLAIVKNILESVDGRIYFSTELNKGSVFTVELPLLNKIV